jgi:TatD DNase family protein
MKYFDAHCHLQFEQYADDRDAVITRMEAQEIGALVVGTDAETSRAACELVQTRQDLYAAVGQHPNHEGNEAFDEHLYRNLLMYPKTVAIGECGLDYFRPAEVTDEVKYTQKTLFEKHMHLAGSTGRPLMIHGRPSKGSMNAYEDLISILATGKREYGDNLRANIHFFVGNAEIARYFFELDCTVSYTAVITFARDYDEAIRYAPLDSLLTETDSPYLAPVNRRGSRNDPLSVIDVVREISRIRGESEETVRLAILQIASRQFLAGAL